MKAILEFDLSPEGSDHYAYECALYGEDFRAVLGDLLQELRKYYKHGDDAELADKAEWCKELVIKHLKDKDILNLDL